MKYKIIALMGEAGSGKDALLKGALTLAPEGLLHEIVSCTTRPIRENEKEGINYFFLTRREFETWANEGNLIEYTEFNNWYYGTPYSSLAENKINIGVFNPAGIKRLMENEDIDLTVFYVHTTPKIRLMRQLNREAYPDVKEIVRRFEADEKDFQNLNFEHTEIQNSLFSDYSTSVKAILEAALGQK